MSKLVNRLRSRQESRYDGGSQDHGWYADELCQEAADEIEALRAKLAQYEGSEVVYVPSKSLEKLEANGEHIGVRTAIYCIERGGFTPIIRKPEVSP